jgi:hypothetical protein
MAANDLIQIQADFGEGRWRTLSHVGNNPQLIANSMKNVQKGHPSKRIRAVDSSGRLVDML